MKGIYPPFLQEYRSIEEAHEAWHRGTVVSIYGDTAMIQQEFWTLLMDNDHMPKIIPYPINIKELEILNE